MKQLMFILMLLVCYSAYSQETDTVFYSNKECGDPVGDSAIQNISFQLENDTLTISGKIIANCCGSHFIIYERFEDSAYFSRLDTGILCDCHCLLDINIGIGGFTSSLYKIKLDEYLGEYGFDTLVNIIQAGIIDRQDEKNVKIFPSPFSGTTTIEFPNPDFDCFTFRMFDCSGRLIQTLSGLKTNSVQLNANNLPGGIYYFNLFNSTGAFYSGKLLIR